MNLLVSCEGVIFDGKKPWILQNDASKAINQVYVKVETIFYFKNICFEARAIIQ